MKKVVLSAALAVLGLVGVNAQVGMEAVELGVRAGYNYSNFSGDLADDFDTEGRSGYHVGLFAEFPVSDRFSIQPEVIYSTQGAKWDVLGTATELKTQNINVPVLAKFYVADGFNLQVGPQVGFNTGDDWEFEGNDIPEAFRADLASVNFGAVVGAGYKMAEGLTIDARYNFGFTNVLDDSNDSIGNMDIDNDFKDGVFSIGLGYSF
ncbi:outer membrane beta-barrel protein [Flavobacteriaceae bacterium Ap0902]|nr:outer membrane beta-barrel protein [Flavobacteriaceae bacterium Ap0902]